MVVMASIYSKFWPKGGVSGVLHHFTESLVAFEFRSDVQHKPDSLVFVGGLSDGLGSIAYVADLVKSLEPTSWSIFQPILSSSYSGWGTGSLDTDVDEIAQCLRYIKDIRPSSGRVVLMGHSTGSQDVLHYLSKEKDDRPVLHGAIMQAPVSDREAIHLILESGFMGRSSSQLRVAYMHLEALAQTAVLQGKEDETLLPLGLTSQFGYGVATPISCRRFLSLVSPLSPQQPGQDDMFSSDLGDEHLRKTFGVIGARGVLAGKLCVLMSGSDQAVPASVDKARLMQRWRTITNGDGGDIWDDTASHVVPNASHALSNDDQAEPRQILSQQVRKFVLGLS